MKYKIVADSSANLTELEGADFASVPLKITTKEKEYVDDPALDVEQMVRELRAYKGPSGTACPSVGDWLEAFGDADIVVGASITGQLSGTWNSAQLAKQEYEAMYPERKVFILDSLSAGTEIQLILEEMVRLVGQEKSYEELERAITEYWKHTHLLFSLESLNNLARNGRINQVVAAAAGLLGIRVVGKASDKGELEPMDKCRGEKKALDTLWKHMQEMGYAGGRVRIGHCENPGAAAELTDKIRTVYPTADVQTVVCRGLCSFYAEQGGLMIGFEDRDVPVT